MTLALRWLHVLAAITWIGGMLFIALVVVPVTRRLDDPALRGRLVQEVGRRFRTVGWIALGLLVLTGLGHLALRPYLLALPRFQWKLGLVLLALVLALIHDFVLGPRAGRPGADPAIRVRASWLARVNVLVVLAVVLLSLALRGQAREAHAGPIHLLLTDVMMPSTRGPELAVGLQAVRPGLRVLYYSGYLGDVVRKRGVPAGEVLPKPFTRGALASAVRLLEAPAPETPPDLA